MINYSILSRPLDFVGQPRLQYTREEQWFTFTNYSINFLEEPYDYA